MWKEKQRQKAFHSNYFYYSVLLFQTGKCDRLQGKVLFWIVVMLSCDYKFKVSLRWHHSTCLNCKYIDLHKQNKYSNRIWWHISHPAIPLIFIPRVCNPCTLLGGKKNQNTIWMMKWNENENTVHNTVE